MLCSDGGQAGRTSASLVRDSRTSEIGESGTGADGDAARVAETYKSIGDSHEPACAEEGSDLVLRQPSSVWISSVSRSFSPCFP
jgi:hypothetical protein